MINQVLGSEFCPFEVIGYNGRDKSIRDRAINSHDWNSHSLEQIT